MSDLVRNPKDGFSHSKAQMKLIHSNTNVNLSFSGFFAYVISFIVLFTALFYEVPVTVVYDKFIPLMTSAILFSFVMSVFLYIKARLAPDGQKAPLGNTGDKCLPYFFVSFLGTLTLSVITLSFAVIYLKFAVIVLKFAVIILKFAVIILKFAIIILKFAF